MIEVIVGICGTGGLSMFGWFIRSTRVDIKTLGVQVNTKIDKLDEKVNTKIDKLDEKVNTKIDKLDEKVDKLDEKVGSKIDKLDEKVNTLTASVAAIAATQAEHGKKLEHMMGHGERISALEGATFGTAAT